MKSDDVVVGMERGRRKKISVELGGENGAWSGFKLMGYGKAVRWKQEE